MGHLRSLVRQDLGMAVASVGSVALTVSLCLAILTVADNALGWFHSDPNVVDLQIITRGGGPERNAFWVTDFENIRKVPAIKNLGGFGRLTLAAAIGGRRQSVVCVFVNRDFLNLIGAPPPYGRMFSDSDGLVRPSAIEAIASSHFLESLSGSTKVVIGGKALTIQGFEVPLVGAIDTGALSRLFGLVPDVLLPLGAYELLHPQGLKGSRGAWLFLRARLDDSYDAASVNEQLHNVPLTLPGPRQELHAIRSAPAPIPARAHLSAAVTAALSALAVMGIIAVLSAASLAAERMRRLRSETAMMLVLGATPAHIVLQRAYESLLLAAIGILVGGITGIGLLRVVARAAPDFVALSDSMMQPSLGPTLIAAAVGLIVACSGVPIVVRLVSAGQPMSHLSSATRGTGRFTRRSVTVALGINVMLATILAGVANLFLTAWHRSSLTDVGFRTEDVFLAQGRWLDSSESEGRVATLNRTLELVRGIPSIEAAAASSRAPLEPPSDIFDVNARPLGQAIFVDTYYVSTDYFTTLRMPLTGNDLRDVGRDLILDEAAARLEEQAAFGSVGSTVTDLLGATIRSRVVVGLVPNVRRDGIRVRSEPTRYLPLAARPVADKVTLLVRTPSPLTVAAVTAALQESGADIAWGPLEPMTRRIASALWQVRVIGTVGLVCALVALSLMALTIYTISSRNVTDRLAEAAIRLAVGGSYRTVSLQLLRSIALTIVAGGLAGMVALFGLLRYFEPIYSELNRGTIPMTTLFTVMFGLAVITIAGIRLFRLEPARLLRLT